MSGSSKWWLIIVILALVALLISLVGPFSALKNSREMGASLQSSLTANGFPDVNVEMDGSIATLTGGVTTEARKADALSLAKNTNCEKCRGKARKWHTVKDGGLAVTLANASPYTFSAKKDGGGKVVLSGFMRSEAEKANVLAHANAVFGAGNVIDRTLKLATGAPNDNWGAIAKAQLTSLGKMQTGEATLGDLKAGLTGTVNSAATRADVLASTGVSAPYKLSTSIAAPKPVAPAPEPEAVIQAAVDNCQAQIDAAKGTQKVNFRYGKAEVSSDSFPMLIALAKAAMACPDYIIRVEGHTDADGSAAYNKALSESRAQVVATFLQEQGVARANLNPVGIGEDRPIATNDTPAGKRQNRRIDFVVTRS